MASKAAFVHCRFVWALGLRARSSSALESALVSLASPVVHACAQPKPLILFVLPNSIFQPQQLTGLTQQDGCSASHLAHISP